MEPTDNSFESEREGSIELLPTELILSVFDYALGEAPSPNERIWQELDHDELSSHNDKERENAALASFKTLCSITATSPNWAALCQVVFFHTLCHALFLC